MARKWSPKFPSDSILADPGLYVVADPLDEHGERAVITAALTWGGERRAFLCDAASSLWGSAPWAMIPLRKAFGMRTLGKFPQAAEAFSSTLPAILEASRSEEGLPSDSGLILLRAAADLAKNPPKPGDTSAALRCLISAREQDRAIFRAKRDEFLRAFPDWGSEQA